MNQVNYFKRFEALIEITSMYNKANAEMPKYNTW